MSTPIQPGELSPEDPKFYAPPRWRSGEVSAPPIQPTLRSPELPAAQVYADWTDHRDQVSFDDAHPTNTVLKPVKVSDSPEQSGMRNKALAIAAGVVMWTAFCVVVGLGRLDAISFPQLRNSLPFASDPKISVGERPQVEDNVLQQVAQNAPQIPARQVPPPSLAAAGAIGEKNTALPFAVKVSDDSPGTLILLSGLVAGTKLSSGSAVGESRWRIAVDDLPNTQVFPPADFVGPMTIVAELRNGDELIARTQLQLVWRPGAIKSSATGEPAVPLAPAAAADDMTKEDPFGQALAWQKESISAQPSPQLKARKHISRSAVTKRRHYNSSPALVMETDTVSRWKTAPASNYATSSYSDARAERRSFGSADVQSLIDGGWERCRYNCARERR